MTLVRLDDPTTIRDSRLLGLFHYWHGKCQGRVMPARRDIDPIESSGSATCCWSISRPTRCSIVSAWTA
jgi:hypothetical protein